MSTPARLIGRTDLTATVTTFCFAPEKPVLFLAGQYIELLLPHDAPDDRGTGRWFTISSRPGEPFLDLTMRLPTKGMSSFKRHLCSLPAGSPVRLGEVLGDFVAPIDQRVPLVFMADGIGLTPFVSMVRDLAAHGDARDIAFYHTVRRAEDRLFYDEFRAYGVHLVSRQLTHTGLIRPESPDPQALFYLAGSETACMAMQAELRIGGIAPARIALDYFSGYPEA